MSEKRNDGGPAFPCSAIVQPDNAQMVYGGAGGMTLRQWYAGQTLKAVLSHEQNTSCLGAGKKEAIKSIAQDCFIMADAMIDAEADL